MKKGRVIAVVIFFCIFCAIVTHSSPIFGKMNFDLSLETSLSNKFNIRKPSITQSLDLLYKKQFETYFVEISANAFGIFGANPYVLVPDIKDMLSINEAYVGFLSKAGVVFIGRYAPLLPVSDVDYRYFGLLFGNPHLPLDNISLYRYTDKFEYEITLGYLSYSKDLLNDDLFNLDLFLAGRIAFEFGDMDKSLQLSPTILLSDLSNSYGFGVPFRVKVNDNILEGDLALYNLLGTSMVSEGLYPAFAIKYYLVDSKLSLEGAYIHSRFLPFTGNFLNFGGTLPFATGTLGFLVSWTEKDATISVKHMIKNDIKKTTTLSVTKKLPHPFSPVLVSLSYNPLQEKRFILDLSAGLTFSF